FGLGNTSSLSAISLTNSVLSVNGSYTIAQLQPLLTGNTLAIGQGGILDNTGNTLTLDGPSQSLTFNGGTLKGGTLTGNNGAKVTDSNFGPADGVTLNGDPNLPAPNAYATIQNGLTLNGTATIGDPNGQSTATLAFNGNQTLAGNGTIKFGTA